MLNDTHIFTDNFPSARNYYCFVPQTNNYCSEMMDLDSRGYFSNDLYSDLVKQDNYRQYEAAMQREAYEEAVERRRQQKILKEQRREYLLELDLERKRLEWEQEKQKRQYLALLEQKRVQQERKDKLRAAACEARKRHTNLRRNFHHRSNPMQQFAQTPSETIYRLFNQPSNVDDKEYPLNKHNLPNRNQNDREENMTPTLSSTRKVLFKNSSSSDQFLESAFSEVQPGKELKPKKGSNFFQKKQIKSSVLIGDVEDASDSECEEDFNDYWHNRRPQSGKWIEPIEGAATFY